MIEKITEKDFERVYKEFVLKDKVNEIIDVVNEIKLNPHTVEEIKSCIDCLYEICAECMHVEGNNWKPKTNKKEPECMEKEIIKYLWQIIDDIDTAGDMAKNNDKAFRNMVEKLQAKRWLTNITSDGYNLDFINMKIPKEEIKSKFKTDCKFYEFRTDTKKHHCHSPFLNNYELDSCLACSCFEPKEKINIEFNCKCTACEADRNSKSKEHPKAKTVKLKVLTEEEIGKLLDIEPYVYVNRECGYYSKDKKTCIAFETDVKYFDCKRCEEIRKTDFSTKEIIDKIDVNLVPDNCFYCAKRVNEHCSIAMKYIEDITVRPEWCPFEEFRVLTDMMIRGPLSPEKMDEYNKLKGML